MKKLCLTMTFLFFAAQFSGCAVIMALRQPEKKNLSVLAQGASRENVITYLGGPITSEQKNGERVDLYQFQQGYSGANKTTRAVVHGLLDIGTFFIWELIATPTEAIVDGKKMTIKVIYDSDDRIKDYLFLSDK